MRVGFYETLLQTCFHRGIFYPTAEIHGEIAGFYEYGSIGTKIKRKFENYWRKFFLDEDNFFEIEGSVINPEKVFRASGHLEHFKDPMVKCKKCGVIERADQILEKGLGKTFEGLNAQELQQLIKENNLKCHECGGELEDIKEENLMFGFKVGAENEFQAYLRPETTQSVVCNFKREYLINRERLPLGLAIIGKAFRNEISARQSLFRMREFTQAELQIFFDPEEKSHPDFKRVENEKVPVVFADEREKGIQIVSLKKISEKYFEKYAYYLWKIFKFYSSLGVQKEKIRFFEKSESERAFYNKAHFDVEIWMNSFQEFREVAGLHYRTDHDLKGHQEVSKQNLTVQKGDRKFIPHILELSFGVDRNIFAFLDLSFEQKDKRIMHLPSVLSPFLAGVYPLMAKDGLDDYAFNLYKNLKEKGLDVFYDDKGSIGKRYARADETGVKYGITIDYDTLKDNTVTIRDRDTTKQIRVKTNEIIENLKI